MTPQTVSPVADACDAGGVDLAPGGDLGLLISLCTFVFLTDPVVQEQVLGADVAFPFVFDGED